MNYKVGIVFKNYGQDMIDKYPYLGEKTIQNEYYNIEVEFNCNLEDILYKLNRYWNKTKKLKSLLPLGFINFLGTNLNETVSEVDEFKRHYGPGKLEVYPTENGYTYYIKDKPSSLDVDLCSTKTLDEIIKDSYDYEWDYVIFFDGKEFKCVKENNLEE